MPSNALAYYASYDEMISLVVRVMNRCDIPVLFYDAGTQCSLSLLIEVSSGVKRMYN